MSLLCKQRSGYLENSAFHESACPRSGGKRFPLWFQKLSLGKLLWEGRYYHYPQILCVGDVCSVKTEVGVCWTRELSVKSLPRRPVPMGAISAVVSSAVLGKVTMGRKILPLSANLAYKWRLCDENWPRNHAKTKSDARTCKNRSISQWFQTLSLGKLIWEGTI